MTSTDNLVHNSPSDAGLNLLCPGLAQLCQKRFGSAALFLVANACASGMFAWSSQNRVLATVILLEIMIWSIIDARTYETRAQPAE